MDDLFILKDEEEVEEDPWVYANPFALDSLRREGKLFHIQEIREQYGEYMGDISTMDPLDLLILEEEL